MINTQVEFDGQVGTMARGKRPVHDHDNNNDNDDGMVIHENNLKVRRLSGCKPCGKADGLGKSTTTTVA